MPQTAPRRLLAYSEDRTIWLRGDVVVKVFERGTLAQAEAEARAGARLQGDDFVVYLGAELDATSNKPAVLTRYRDAPDLARLVSQHGPLAPTQLCAVGSALARALQRLHGFAVHRDVKPSNLLVPTPETTDVVVLLDAEHVYFPREATLTTATFSGGTREWAPPEAHRGASPDSRFDVFGLGATLAYAATARLPRLDSSGRRRALPAKMLAHLPGELRELISACLAPEPAARPKLVECLATLQRSHAAATQEAAPLSRARHLVAKGLGHDALTTLHELADPTDPDTRRQVAALRRSATNLEARITSALQTAAGVDFAALARRIARTEATLARAPGHAGLRHNLDTARRALADQLEALPGRIAELKRRARFAAADTLLAAAGRALRATTHLGGPAPALADGSSPAPLQRAPSRLLQLTADDLAAARDRHTQMLGELTSAEAQLDLLGVAQAIDHASAIYSGASEVVAELKDRLHRLTYFIERLAQPRDGLDALRTELVQLSPAPGLSQLDAVLERCRKQTDPTRAPRSALGVRALLRTLRELTAELPATTASTAAACRELEGALLQLAQQAWAIVDDSKKKLGSVPIPVRPLQNQLAQLDHLRLLDALADAPRGTRADLLDQMERLRTDVDQARTTRDRIASGARQAMERGHLTTALYDMARAVDRYDAPAEELEEARQRKRAIEDAVRENHRLAARYSELEDDPNSSFAERLAALDQRKQVLTFLIERVTAERAATYTQDRLDVGVRTLQEQTADAERRHDASGEPSARLEIARATEQSLEEFAQQHADDRDRLGRVTRMREHWQSLAGRAEADLARTLAASRERERRYRKSLAMRTLVVGMALALLVVLWLLVRQSSSGPR